MTLEIDADQHELQARQKMLGHLCDSIFTPDFTNEFLFEELDLNNTNSSNTLIYTAKREQIPLPSTSERGFRLGQVVDAYHAFEIAGLGFTPNENSMSESSIGSFSICATKDKDKEFVYVLDKEGSIKKISNQPDTQLVHRLMRLLGIKYNGELMLAICRHQDSVKVTLGDRDLSTDEMYNEFRFKKGSEVSEIR